MAACGIIEIEERDSAPTVPSDVSSVPDAVPKAGYYIKISKYKPNIIIIFVFKTENF